MKKYNILLIIVLMISCSNKKSSGETSIKEKKVILKSTNIKSTSIVILGTIQDAGSPQIGCIKSCCINLFDKPDNKRKIVSLGLIDIPNDKTYLFEATPDMSEQMTLLSSLKTQSNNQLVDGIFLTHAHIGHYTGLIYLGKEALDSKNVLVFVMPKMKEFLINNGPWSQLVKRENIRLSEMEAEKSIQLSSNIQVIPFLVPHRDEYSETIGYKIIGPNKSALLIPDIDKWGKWKKNILDEIKKVDFAFLDATYYSKKEISNRDISQIPHPFIIESLERFESLSKQEKNKIVFIHFNHTNPIIDTDSEEAKIVLGLGYKIGKINDVFEL